MLKDKPRVFLFGTNPASVLNNLALGLRENGVPVKAVSFDFRRSGYNNYSAIELICSDNQPGRFKIYAYKLKGLFLLIRYLLWCDVVHVYGNISNISYWLMSKLARNKFISFVGSDIRVPEIELAQNPYFKYAYEDAGYEYKAEANNRTSEMLQYLRKLGFKFIVWDVAMFFDEDLQEFIARVPHSSANAASAKHTDNAVPLLIHSPTAPVAKGSKYVLAAVEKLKERKVEIDFRLLQNMPNDVYQQALDNADIYIDQLMWGAYGVAAQQAMEMGKTVVAYITPQNAELYGPDCPIQNANINDLADVLEKLVKDKALRESIGKQSVSYYNKMHKPSAVAAKMLQAYRELSSKN
ncbi:MAG: hypothetical protein JWQ27_2516 [Ferruginibacter sp.]|nr:hypothetical protein [Ferruginibacter sp.]